MNFLRHLLKFPKFQIKKNIQKKFVIFEIVGIIVVVVVMCLGCDCCCSCCFCTLEERARAALRLFGGQINDWTRQPRSLTSEALRCLAAALCCAAMRCDRRSDRATQRPNRRTKERASDTARQTDKRFNTRPPSLPLPTSPYRPTALLLSCSWCVCRLYEWVTAWRSCQLTAAWWVCCVCVSLLLLLLLRPLRVSHVARRAAVHNGLM